MKKSFKICTADELEQASPLEMCYFLGKLQEPHYSLSKPKGVKGKDATIKLPMLAYALQLPCSEHWMLDLCFSARAAAL